MKRKLITLEEAVQAVVDKHGGIRAASRITGVDKAFISRLLRGYKTAPSEETLNRLGLESVPLYVVMMPNDQGNRLAEGESSGTE